MAVFHKVPVGRLYHHVAILKLLDVNAINNAVEKPRCTFGFQHFETCSSLIPAAETRSRLFFPSRRQPAIDWPDQNVSNAPVW